MATLTYNQILSLARKAAEYGISNYLNNGSIIVYDPHHIGFKLTKWAEPYPNAEGLFTQTIIPQETYSKINDWSNDPSNTGIGLNSSTYSKIYNGDGPYMINSLDPNTGYANLSVSPIWNSTNSNYNQSYVQQFQIPGYSKTPTIKSVAIKIMSDPTKALMDIENGTVDIFDTSYRIHFNI